MFILLLSYFIPAIFTYTIIYKQSIDYYSIKYFTSTLVYFLIFIELFVNIQINNNIFNIKKDYIIIYGLMLSGVSALYTIKINYILPLKISILFLIFYYLYGKSLKFKPSFPGEFGEMSNYIRNVKITPEESKKLENELKNLNLNDIRDVSEYYPTKKY